MRANLKAALWGLVLSSAVLLGPSCDFNKALPICRDAGRCPDAEDGAGGGAGGGEASIDEGPEGGGGGEAPLGDWLTQDVCVDADGGLLADDPMSCLAGARRRDLRPGERLPYHRSDQPTPSNPLGLQRRDSFPMWTADGGLRFVSQLDLGPFGDFQPDRDGYDVIEADGAFASLVGARAPSGLALSYFAPGCQLDDAWLLFPLVHDGGPGSRQATLAEVGWEGSNQAFPGACPSAFGDAQSTWAVVDAFPFGGVGGATSKPLRAIIATHVAGADRNAADHFERLLFTREYGLTRRERWERGAAARTDGCTGATVDGEFARVDCHDWSVVLPASVPWPARAWPQPYAEGNRLENGDLGAGALTGWNHLGQSDGGHPTSLNLATGPGGNFNLATDCGGPCSPGQSVHHDMPLGSLTGDFDFGCRVWTDSGTGPVELVVFQRSVAGEILARHGHAFVASATPAEVSVGPSTVQPAVVQLRLSVYLSAPNLFHIDDCWIAARR